MEQEELICCKWRRRKEKETGSALFERKSDTNREERENTTGADYDKREVGWKMKENRQREDKPATNGGQKALVLMDDTGESD